MTSKCRTPLRWPGGKNRAVKILEKYIPNDFEEFREPFLGGGSFFIQLIQKYPNKNFWINDIYYNLYCFWKELKDNGETLVEKLLEIKKTNIETNPEIKLKNRNKETLKKDTQKSRELFAKAKENINSIDKSFDIAINFFILNKCSYSGLTEIGTFSPQASISNFSFGTINKLKNISTLLQNVKITNLDYSKLLKEDGRSVFIYLDPPYDILENNKNKALYGKQGKHHILFDHERFYKDIIDCEHQFLISYNDSNNIRDRYKNFNIINFNLKYGMQYKKESFIKNIKIQPKPFIKEKKDEKTKLIAKTKKELLIKNYE